MWQIVTVAGHDFTETGITDGALAKDNKKTEKKPSKAARRGIQLCYSLRSEDYYFPDELPLTERTFADTLAQRKLYRRLYF
ncbi:hypothetical protein E2C01_032643 [Portunus trituberculatus]|uniref:Uncharacterized protein n=1 Tax=Portunus trituberculatus TaxID=210409 RepID=A0A5B7EY13_PORTR|nr:hypothetical protein [Portunus trituberculatus]